MDRAFVPEKMPPFMRGEKVREGTPFYAFLAYTVRALATVLYDIEVKGIENLPTDRGYILAANHDRGYHTILISMLHYFMGQPIHWVAKIELFRGLSFRVLGLRIVIIPEWIATKFTYAIRCIPLIRKKSPLVAARAIKLITSAENKGAVAIFPEGTRNKNGKKETSPDSNAGAILFAQLAGCADVPTRIKSTPPSILHWRKGTYTVEYGEPYYPPRGPKPVELLPELVARMEALGCFGN